MTDLVSQLVGALKRLLATGGCIAEATDADLQQSIDDPHADEIVQDQAAAVLQARAALTAAKAGGWQDISTAPRDGSMFLCWVEAVRYGETDEGQQYQEDVSQVDFCDWRTNADIPDGGWFDPSCGQIGDAQRVTKWQPLPTPPKEQA